MAKPSSPERRERLAAALRENLKRRKAQARTKEKDRPSHPADPIPHDGPDAVHGTLSEREPPR